MRPQHIYPILFSALGLFNPQKLCCLCLALLLKKFLAIQTISSFCHRSRFLSRHQMKVVYSQEPSKNTTTEIEIKGRLKYLTMKNKHNNAINTDPKKLRCAPLFGSGYGWRYATLSL